MVDSNLKKIVLDVKKFLGLNYELRIIILNMALKFVNSRTFQIRSKKIDYLIRKMASVDNISLQSQKTLVKRNEDFIIISKID